MDNWRTPLRPRFKNAQSRSNWRQLPADWLRPMATSYNPSEIQRMGNTGLKTCDLCLVSHPGPSNIDRNSWIVERKRGFSFAVIASIVPDYTRFRVVYAFTTSLVDWHTCMPPPTFTACTWPRPENIGDLHVMDETAEYICPHCGESIQIVVDPNRMLVWPCF